MQNINSKYGVYPLPKWCFTKDVCLIDIQTNREDRELYFIFRKKDGKKEIHVERDDKYYFYKKIGNPDVSDMTEHINNVTLEKRFLSKDERHNDKFTIYEGDVRSELKYSIDYYLQRNEPELIHDLNVMFADIEVYMGKTRNFPDPKLAKHPINSISFKSNKGVVHVYLANIDNNIDKKIFDMKLPDHIKVFNTEAELLNAFVEKVNEFDPDVMTGWNFDFDMFTIVGRLEKNGIDPIKLSPLKRITINREKDILDIHGIVILDMLRLYKKMTPNKEESYKLSFIAQKNLGKDKIAFEGLLDHQYTNNIEKFIEYSSTDTMLLFELSEKLNHIRMQRELVRICSSTWNSGKTTTGLLDPLVISYAKKSGLVCKNAPVAEISDTKIIGAYVKEPEGGIYSYIVDFDYTSLYPSIIMSFNIGPNTYSAKINEDIAMNYIYKKYDLMPDKFDITLSPLKKPNSIKTVTKEQFMRWMKKENNIINPYGTIFLNHEKELSFFNKILSYLLDSRKTYKKEMFKYKNKDDTLFDQYNNIQWAYKIVANSLYGVLVNPWFRMSSRDLGSSVTVAGRELNQFAQYHLGHFMKSGKEEVDYSFMDDFDNKEVPYVLYSDTDSMFINIYDWLVDKKMV